MPTLLRRFIPLLTAIIITLALFGAIASTSAATADDLLGVFTGPPRPGSPSSTAPGLPGMLAEILRR
jgi:hypothetical protein